MPLMGNFETLKVMSFVCEFLSLVCAFSEDDNFLSRCQKVERSLLISKNPLT